MTNSASSLDRLHDIVLPPEVPWWPPAPGWYVVIAVALALVLVFLYRTWAQWRANAYRRAALRELASASDAPAMAELLRRTALVVAPREVIAGKTGEAWVDWLAAQSPGTMSPAVRSGLTIAIYGAGSEIADTTPLRDYATGWIRNHRQQKTGGRE